MIFHNPARALLPCAAVLLLAACGGGDAADAAAADTAVVVAPLADSARPAAPGPTAPPAADADTAAPAPAAAAPQGTPAAPAEGSTAERIAEPPASGPVNVETLERYDLSMDRLRQLVRAGQHLGELQSRRPELRDSMRLEAFDPNAIYQKLNSIPDARQAIARAGMTPREYATATAALMQAAMVAEMRKRGMTPQVQVNEDNVRFVTENWDEIQQMMMAVAAQARPRS